jgi:lipopolysaccharide export system protein LptA
MKLRYPWSMLLLLILHAEVNALSTDQDKPFEVEADSAIVDENLGSTIYRGDVSIVQGSLKILADEIEIITSGGDVVQIIARTDENSDRLAHLEQQPDNKERVFAEARSINYYIQEQRVNLTGEARLRQMGDEFTGEIVYYDVGQGIVNLKSGSESERIKIKYNTAK